MAAPTPEAIELARKRVDQAKARLDALNARVAAEGRCLGRVRDRRPRSQRQNPSPCDAQ